MVALKIPSIDLRDDRPTQALHDGEWVARRIDSPHVLKPCTHSRKRNFLYVVTEFIDGQTLTQWMVDNPRPDLETVRGIIEQIARACALSPLEMLHQDLRPENVMIDKTGSAKIIDFGSVRNRPAWPKAAPSACTNDILGTVQYTAPNISSAKAARRAPICSRSE